MRFRSAVGVIVALLASHAAGKQIQFGFAIPATHIELTAPHVETISGATAARLEQARALAAGRDWDEAIDIWRDLAAEKTDRVVALDGDRYVSLRTYCQLQLARLPAEGLSAYRRRVDRVAEQWYRDGVAKRDEELLRRVVDQLFCSSWGDDALLALGDLALERGDYAAARRSWEQISPLLRGPDGTPMWLALYDIDLRSKWPEVERAWNERKKPPDWLAYPDTQIDLADVRARLVLASIRAGQFERAALELETFRQFHPNATGEIGGQKGNYVEALDRLLAAARQWPAEPATGDWPTFAGSQARSAVAAPLGKTLVPTWKEPIPLNPPTFARVVPLVQGAAPLARLVAEQPETAVRESQRPLGCFPIVVGGAVAFADGVGIRAADVATGKPAITGDGVLFRNEATGEKRIVSPFGVAGGVAHGVPRLTLNHLGGVLYSRVGSFATSRAGENQSSADRIIGLDLRREGLLTFRARPEAASWSFDGAPVGDGRRLFVALRHSDVTPHAYVACFDAASGALRWQTSIGAADTPAGDAGDEITHNLLTLVENRIYFNSNLGLVTSLDVDTGEICWIARYERFAGKVPAFGVPGPPHFDRDPSPCMYKDGLLVVAPSDTAAIFALEAETGKFVWRQNELPDAVHLLGVVDNRVIASGDRLASLDFESGRVQWNWPDSDRAGIRGMGRGVVAGIEIFWPTRSEILAVDCKTGAQTRSPISLAPLAGGANLIASQGRLIAAGYDKLMVFGPPVAESSGSIGTRNANDVVRTGRLSDQSELK